MKVCILLFSIIVLQSCQTAKVKTDQYDTSNSIIELGAIGHGKSLDFDKGFSVRVYPMLTNNIRVDVQVLPYTKNLNNLYRSKKKFNQVQPESTFVDSLPSKPEYLLITLLDVAGYIREVNADSETTGFLKSTENAATVSSIALSIAPSEIQKIRLSDSYYLVNKFDSKYSLALFKNGKQTDLLELDPKNVLAYKLGYFCWAQNNRGHWLVADINDGPDKCKGKSRRYIKEKSETNLFKM